MTNEHFILTVREDDLREVYEDSLTYRFNSDGNRPVIQSATLFFTLAVFSFIQVSSNSAYFFLLLCFILAFGYQLTRIIRDYLKFKRKKKLIENWIESLKKYKAHTIEFGDTFFKYTRDDEVFVFNLNEEKEIIRSANLFYFDGKPDGTILLPRKSFAEGEFDKFILNFDERNNAVNAALKQSG